MNTTDTKETEMSKKEAARTASRFLKTIFSENIDYVANISYAEACIIDSTNRNQSKVLVSYLEQVEEFISKLKTSLTKD